MAITVCPVTESFAAEIGDIDLSRPIEPADLAAVKEAFTKYAVLVFPEQHLSDDQHLDFARHFGPLETTIALFRKDAKLRVRKQFADVSNLNGDGEIRARTTASACSSSATGCGTRTAPSSASRRVLAAVRAVDRAIGGHTEFADQRAGYDALPAAIKRELRGDRRALHLHFTGRIGFTNFRPRNCQRAPARAAGARAHDSPKRPQVALCCVSRGPHLRHAGSGGRGLIDKLIAHTTQRQFVYTHRWRQHDLVMWDNRCTMHRGTEFDDLRWRRDVQRATVCDVANTCEQAGITIAAA